MELKRLWTIFFSCSIALGVFAAEGAVKDTREGENVSLECHFPPQLSDQKQTYFWIRKNKNEHENVAIDKTPYGPNYKVDFQPDKGRYALWISNVSYAKDDGTFECRVKVAISGEVIHNQTVTLIVLTPPGPPVIPLGLNPTATEGTPIELNCSSYGGSPEPKISWYKNGSTYPLGAETRTRDSVTTSVLSLKPSMKDDGATYRCVVWNRAMPDGTKLETRLTLNVNYFPRVSVGPENPLKVERDGSVTLQCNVEAKPWVNNVRWTRNGNTISTLFNHTIHRVSVQDAGKYTCTANNGLGQTGEAHIMLDVLYPPTVTIEAGAGSGAVNIREANEGASLVVRCNVTANPEPITVEWVRQTHHEFRHIGPVLQIDHVTAENAGTYTCRAVNEMATSGQMRRRVEGVGNATFTLLVRHKPGKASITPETPVAVNGSNITLSCSANPPGWPTPQYKWWRDIEDNATSSVLHGQKNTITLVQLSSEGKYHCRASNVLGNGMAAGVMLQVYQPPQFIKKLQYRVTRRIGDSEYSVYCEAEGKPKPSVRWLKDGYEIMTNPQMEVNTQETEGRNSVYTVQSTLRFRGGNRQEGNQLTAGDRGVYSCVFENEVMSANSSMQLRIEHEPIVLHQYNKVAYDVGESAEVVCRVQAYPRPEFKWSYGTNAAPLDMNNDGHYEINSISDEGDVYTSILKIANIRDADYGDYTCNVSNNLGKINTLLRLQQKGPPENPLSISAASVGPNYVTLNWEPGFDGGLLNTKFFVSYRRVPGTVEDAIMGDCGGYDNPRRSNGEWQEFDCQRNNPCNVTSLDQHYSYTFKVKAFNTKGNSNYSAEVTAITKVDRITAPQRVTYDPDTHQLSINSAATCLQLIAFIEAGTGDDDTQWRLIETLPMLPGPSATRREATILALAGQKKGNNADDDFRNVKRHLVRVKFCLRQEQEHCSDATEAEIGPLLIKETASLTTPTLIAIVVSCVVFILFAGLMYVFCRCKRNRSKGKGKGKDYEVEQSVHPSLVTQPPPPYYPASPGLPGMENQALERSMDCDASNKPPLYGYHAGMPHSQHHNPNGGEWVNMGYMDNSYSNSNNGGSVNSQDSLWQMKMAAAQGGVSGPGDVHHLTDRYGYDPIAHGGYGTAVDDYAPYPHRLEHNNTPSRQEYGMSDPYAPIHKAKKRFDQHLDAPGYHDVSGLPDPYMDQMDCEENKPQHVSLSFDESLESGYSTPNSRNRRVIREIIV